MMVIDGALQSGRFSQYRCSWRSRVSDPNALRITPQLTLPGSVDPSSAKPSGGRTGETPSRVGTGHVCSVPLESGVSCSLTRQIGGEKTGWERGEIHFGFTLRLTVEAGSHVSMVRG